MPLPLADTVITLDELARLLGRDEGYLRRNWLRLHRRHGFPRRHPTGWTWPRSAVAAWLSSGGVAEPEPEAIEDDVSHQAAWRAAMSERYGARA